MAKRTNRPSGRKDVEIFGVRWKGQRESVPRGVQGGGGTGPKTGRRLLDLETASRVVQWGRSREERRVGTGYVDGLQNVCFVPSLVRFRG